MGLIALLTLLGLGTTMAVMSLFDDDDSTSEDTAVDDTTPTVPPSDLIEDTEQTITATTTNFDGTETTVDLAVTDDPFAPLPEIDLSDPLASLDLAAPPDPNGTYAVVADYDNLSIEGYGIYPFVGTLYYSPSGAFPPEDDTGLFELPDDAVTMTTLDLGTDGEVNDSSSYNSYNSQDRLELSNIHFGLDPNNSFNASPAITASGAEVPVYGPPPGPIADAPELFRVEISNAGAGDDAPFSSQGETLVGYDEGEILLVDPSQGITLSALETTADPAPNFHLVDLNSFAEAGSIGDVDIGSAKPEFRDLIAADTADLALITTEGDGDPLALQDGTWVLADGATLQSLIKGSENHFDARDAAGDFDVAPEDIVFLPALDGQDLTIHTYASLSDGLPLEAPPYTLSITHADGTVEALDDTSAVDLSDPTASLDITFEDGAEGYLHRVTEFTQYEGSVSGGTWWVHETYIFYSDGPELPDIPSDLNADGTLNDAHFENIFDPADAKLIAVVNLGDGWFNDSQLNDSETKHFTEEDRRLNVDPLIASNLSIETDSTDLQRAWVYNGILSEGVPDQGPEDFEVFVTDPAGSGGETDANWDAAHVVIRETGETLAFEFEEDYDRTLHVIDVTDFPGADTNFVDWTFYPDGENGVFVDTPQVAALVASNSTAPPVEQFNGKWRLVSGAEALTSIHFDGGAFDAASAVTANKPLAFYTFASFT